MLKLNNYKHGFVRIALEQLVDEKHRISRISCTYLQRLYLFAILNISKVVLRIRKAKKNIATLEMTDEIMCLCLEKAMRAS